MKIGITGHQQRKGIDWGWVEARLESEIDGRQIDAVYSSLAIGSDQLFVSVALRRALPIIGVIPFEGYERTFDERQNRTYLELRDACTKVIVLDWPGNDETAYLNAGKWIVSATNLLFAVWDGKQAEGIGGTADIVKFARERDKPVLHINPIEKVVRLLPA
jgi:hypothetical protein